MFRVGRIRGQLDGLVAPAASKEQTGEALLSIVGAGVAGKLAQKVFGFLGCAGCVVVWVPVCSWVMFMFVL